MKITDALLLVLLVSACGPGLDPRARSEALWDEAERGNPSAQYELGRRLETGIGGERDEAAAAEWYTLAAEGGSVAAQLYLADLIAAGRLGLERDEDAVSRWLLMAAVRDNLDAQMRMSKRYRNGIGTPVDRAKSQAWLMRAARLGHPEALTRTAKLFLTGEMVYRNDGHAVRAIHASARAGVPDMEATLGWMYAHGVGVPVDSERAVVWLSSALAHGYAPAAFTIERLNRYRDSPHELEDIWQYDAALPSPGRVRVPIAALIGLGSRIPVDARDLRRRLTAMVERGYGAAAHDLAWSLYLDQPRDYPAAVDAFRTAFQMGHEPSGLVLVRLGEPSTE